jgi:hypothetical protein
MREPGPPGWGSLRWDSKVWFWVLSDSDHWVITPQIAVPSSRQRGLPTDTRPQISNSNILTGSNIWSQIPQGCSIPRHTDWLTVSRKVTSTSSDRLYTKNRPGLSSERAPHRDRTTNSRHKLLIRKKYPVKRPQSGLDTKTCWLWRMYKIYKINKYKNKMYKKY